MTNFSIKNALRESWELYKKHYIFFIAMTVLVVLLNIATADKKTNDLLISIAGIILYVWSMVWLNVSLSAGKENFENFLPSKIHTFFVNIVDVIKLTVIDILSKAVVLLGVMVVAAGFAAIFFGNSVIAFLIIGSILVLIGLYVAFRFFFARYIYLDQKIGIKQSLRISWKMTEGKIINKVALTALVAAMLYIIGMVGWGIGLLIMYPLMNLLIAKLYLALKHKEEIIVQPVEIPASL